MHVAQAVSCWLARRAKALVVDAVYNKYKRHRVPNSKYLDSETDCPIRPLAQVCYNQSTEPSCNLPRRPCYIANHPRAQRRVLARGWTEQHATTLDADALLVRYLKAEHEPLKLDDPDLLPAG